MYFKIKITLVFISLSMLLGCSSSSTSEDENISTIATSTEEITVDRPVSTHTPSTVPEATPITIVQEPSMEPKLKITTVKNFNTQAHTTHIKWSLTMQATGQVEYGESTSYGKFTIKETSFKYDTHIQQIWSNIWKLNG